MKKIITLITATLLFSVSAQAQIKDCDELKDEIHAKIEGNGVESFDLKIVDADEAGDFEGYKIVGSCEAGSQKILYKNLYKG